jgi:phage terminase small subunit
MSTATDTSEPARPVRKRHRRPKYSSEPLATVPPAEQWGPALAALTDKQRKFVLELHGGPSAKYGRAVRAARASNYGTVSSSDGSMRALAAQALSDPKVQAAMRELGPKAVTAEGFASIANIASIANDPKVKPETRLKANIALLAHAFPIETHHHVTVEHIDHDAEAVAQLRILKGLGVARAKLEEVFGVNGITRFERLLQIEDSRRADAAKVIDGEVTS